MQPSHPSSCRAVFQLHLPRLCRCRVLCSRLTCCVLPRLVLPGAAGLRCCAGAELQGSSSTAPHSLGSPGVSVIHHPQHKPSCTAQCQPVLTVPAPTLVLPAPAQGGVCAWHCCRCHLGCCPRAAEGLCASFTLLLCHCLSPLAVHYQPGQSASVSLEFGAIKC